MAMQWAMPVMFGCLLVAAVKVEGARWEWSAEVPRVLGSPVALCRSGLAMVPWGGMWRCLVGLGLRMVAAWKSPGGDRAPWCQEVSS